MAVLADEDRRRTWGHFMRQGSVVGSLTGLVKADLRAAVNATDSWIDSNQGSFNSALPQPARGALSAAQKTVLFCYVAMRRANLLRTDDDG